LWWRVGRSCCLSFFRLPFRLGVRFPLAFHFVGVVLDSSVLVGCIYGCCLWSWWSFRFRCGVSLLLLYCSSYCCRSLLVFCVFRVCSALCVVTREIVVGISRWALFGSLGRRLLRAISSLSVVWGVLLCVLLGRGYVVCRLFCIGWSVFVGSSSSLLFSLVPFAFLSWLAICSSGSSSRAVSVCCGVLVGAVGCLV